MSKRGLSDSECDDLFSDTKESCMTSPGSESFGVHGGGVSRKKRRGIIEKRRRDRINNSLAELRRLVPTAFEKQGSAKLEKAEILQMTVDHLKMLHSKGVDALSYDPAKFALDYHSIGFRECATEVARYLVAVEGWDIQDQLRLRLMSHLQCFAAQRELANKQASASAPWGIPPPLPANPSSYGSLPPPPHSTTTPQHHPMEPPLNNNNPHLISHHQLQQGQGYMGPSPDMPHLQNHGGQGQMTLSSQYGGGQGNPYPNHHQGGKPYRPWGAELAY